MEAYFIKMHTHPEVVEAATDRVCGFYFEANERFFDLAGDRVDALFFGNDFGTQLDQMISPALFDRFIMPWFRRFTSQAHRRGYQVVLHSCGSIHRVIPKLIAAGVNCLHPLQAKAANMDAATLARDFGGKIAFLGGVDTQRVLPLGTPEEVKARGPPGQGDPGPASHRQPQPRGDPARRPAAQRRRHGRSRGGMTGPAAAGAPFPSAA